MWTQEEAAAPHGDEAGRARVEADGQEGAGSSRAEQAAAAPSGMGTRPGELAVRLANWKVGGASGTRARGVQDDQAHPALPSGTASRF